MRAHRRKAAREPEALLGLPARMHFGPAAWLAGPGAWESAAQALAAWPQPVGLLGEAGLLKAFRRPLTAAFLEGGLPVELLSQADGTDCSTESVAAVLAQARARNVKSLLALGGGRMMDLGKLAAQAAGWRLATAPTSAATAACGTAVAVRNDAQGAFAAVEDLPGPPELCVVETSAVAQAPSRLLAAGMADTLAKWMEWRSVEGAPATFGAAAGWALARQAAEACESLGAEALAVPGSAAQGLCVEACLLWSAVASCAGEAPAAAAHSLANALTCQAPGRALLHGQAVGLGLLWQESLLQTVDRETMGSDRLRALLAAWSLPTALPPGLDLDRLAMDALAEDETVHLLGLTLDPSMARRHLPVEA